MFEILQKKELTKNIFLMELSAPLIAKKVQSGQFLIIRVDEEGERFPLTVADFDREKGTVTIIYHAIGKSTQKLAQLEIGESALDVVGPLGKPSHFEDSVKKAAVIGGGLGCAIAYPQAKHLHQKGVSVDMIAGFRTKDIIILEDEMKKVCENLYVATDDGSYGEHGFVTDVLKKLIASGVKYDVVVAIGPLPMMKFVSKLTKEYGIKTIVSMNPIMIDGTGMCGGCRLTVGGETKFACVDGPDFDGHEVDFDGAMRRLSMYDGMQREADCRLEGMK
jgi:ferredoxin--NADP+ reductase